MSSSQEKPKGWGVRGEGWGVRGGGGGEELGVRGGV